MDTSRWSLDLLNALEWKRFEEVCAWYFEALGFTVRAARCGADGGVDIHLYWPGREERQAIVQCKAWRTYKVGVKPIRELFGVMNAEKVGKGIFVTAGMYTKEAKEWATAQKIHLMDGRDLLQKIQALKEEQKLNLLRKTTAGDYTTPTCPTCGIKTVLRENKKRGDTFWGCMNYPKCRFTLKG